MNTLGALRLPVHSSWTLASAAAAVVAGLGAAPQLSYLANYWWMLGGLALVIVSLIVSKRFILVLAVLGGLMIGGSRGAVDLAAKSIWDQAIGQTVVMSGTIAEDIDRGKKGEITLRLRDLRHEKQDLPGEIWLALAKEPSLRRSDRLTVKVELQPGFGSYVASGYRAQVQKVARPQPGDVALDIRDWFGAKVRKVIDEPMASLGLGFLTGQRRSLPADLDQALRVAGLTHIVVASGYNLTILVRLVKRLFEKSSRFQTLFFASLLIVGFIAVTGLTPSMMRAGLVTGLALLAWYVGRQFHPIRLLVLAAAITGLMTPSYVSGNLGWQLSFAAFAGVMVLAPLFQRYFFGEKQPSLLRQILGETLAATIMTLPLLLVYFGQFSSVALLANILVLPLVPLAMLATFVAGGAAILIPTSLQLFAWPAQMLLGYMLEVTRFFTGLDWALVDLQIEIWQGGLLYLLIGLGTWQMWRTTKLNLRSHNIID